MNIVHARNKHLLIIVIIFFNVFLFALFGFAHAAFAATYYVATTGSDSNSGSLSAPFKIIQKAADVVQPGDTIYVRAGTYQGVVLHISGTQSAPITLSNYPGEKPIVQGKGVSLFAGWGVAIGWINVQGLEIINVPDNAVWFNSAHDVIFRGNYIHDNPAQGVLGNGYKVTFDGNNISRNGLPYALNNSQNAWCYPKCDNKYHGIYMSGTYNTIINNLFEGNAAYGLQLAAYPWDPNDSNRPAGPEYMTGQNWLVANNVFAYQLNREGIVVWQSVAINNVFENNIFYNNNTLNPGSANGISFYRSGGGNIVKNNIYLDDGDPISCFYGGVDYGTSPCSAYTESGRIVADPKFVNPSAHDFHLQNTSPARDAGLSVSAVTTDYAGVLRPQGSGYDIGAYEYVIPSTGSGPAAADLNSDSRVNSVDAAMLMGSWGSTARPKADINQDGIVNSVDASLMMGQWSG